MDTIFTFITKNRLSLATDLYDLVFLVKVGLGFFLCSVREICAMLVWYLQQPKNYWSKIKVIFMCNVVWSLKNVTLQIILQVQCCPMSIKTTLINFFRVQCFLGPLGQHCIRFLPVQCCPKSIKTSFNNIFFPVHCYLDPQGQHHIG